MTALLRFLPLLSGLKLKRVGEFAWDVLGKEKAQMAAGKRADVFVSHLRTKHPEWFTSTRLSIPLTGGIGASYVVIMLAVFYALRCAATHGKCKHKP